MWNNWKLITDNKYNEENVVEGCDATRGHRTSRTYATSETVTLTPTQQTCQIEII